ncbi:uncharacterized protein BO88DRAFT_220680 [Aspergillus vadensis CBS 113365]|uniref:Uncharacterized protein n=1 Tax=Aspergillus vadensis (strain CBS 113365 / IMI 142717 / IBT 24658) TaxID=1448311 RepID=A0A319C3A9_ASPVC|nr:hypothetical protein BO88DRAFT_220680 [Aspergillus vadensis CBS 113365]PYH63362.1 hypothetical protein BO88DRAFT_220680 [Aspergillus vadensis CBS 113365]
MLVKPCTWDNALPAMALNDLLNCDPSGPLRRSIPPAKTVATQLRILLSPAFLLQKCCLLRSFQQLRSWDGASHWFRAAAMVAPLAIHIDELYISASLPVKDATFAGTGGSWMRPPVPAGGAIFELRLEVFRSLQMPFPPPPYFLTGRTFDHCR